MDTASLFFFFWETYSHFVVFLSFCFNSVTSPSLASSLSLSLSLSLSFSYRETKQKLPNKRLFAYATRETKSTETMKRLILHRNSGHGR